MCKKGVLRRQQRHAVDLVHSFIASSISSPSPFERKKRQTKKREKVSFPPSVCVHLIPLIGLSLRTGEGKGGHANLSLGKRGSKRVGVTRPPVLVGCPLVSPWRLRVGKPSDRVQLVGCLWEAHNNTVSVSPETLFLSPLLRCLCRTHLSVVHLNFATLSTVLVLL